MPGVSVVVRGTVHDVSTGTPVESGRACLTRGDTLVARAPIDARGSFRLEAADLADGSYHVLVLASGLGGWRRRLEVAGAPVDSDVGQLALRTSELPAGVHGQAWDVAADRPVFAGRMTLMRGAQPVATAEFDGDGWFSFDLTCRQPLPPGAYALVPRAAGYTDEPTPLALVEAVTVYQLGRVNLSPAGPATPAGP